MEESKIRPSLIDLDNRTILNSHARDYALPCIEIIKLMGESATHEFEFKKHHDNFWLLFTKYDNDPFALGYLYGRLARMNARYGNEYARKWAFHWMQTVDEYASAMFHGILLELYELACGWNGSSEDIDELERIEKAAEEDE